MIAGDQYLEAKVMTATPWQLHLIVVDGAIRCTLRAEQALAAKDFETVHFSLNDARGFVGELIAGTNAEHQPELVERLRAMFAFVYRNLVEADLQHDAQQIADALKILRMHRESWVQLGEKLRQENAGTVTPTEHIATVRTA